MRFIKVERRTFSENLVIAFQGSPLGTYYGTQLWDGSAFPVLNFGTDFRALTPLWDPQVFDAQLWDPQRVHSQICDVLRSTLEIIFSRGLFWWHIKLELREFWGLPHVLFRYP